MIKKRLLAFFDPTYSISLFIIGTSALTLVLQALYDFANQPDEFKGGYWLAIIAFVIAIASLLVSFLWRRKPIRIEVEEQRKPKPSIGLVVLVGTHKASAPAAIEYHIPELRYLWLVTSSASLQIAEEIKKSYQDRVAHIYTGQGYLAEFDQVDSTYQIVERILKHEIKDLGLKPKQIMLDITGATKPMTSGLFLAGFANRASLQYMKAARDEEGVVKKEALAFPVRIETNFSPLLEQETI